MKPRRSILSVPGHVEKMHGKSSVSNADVIMLDLEDSVPLEAKEKARAQVIQSLLTRDWTQKTVTVRINSLDTPFAYRDLLEVVENTGHILDAIVIPKVNSPGDISFVDRMLDGIEMNKGLSQRLGIEASIETAKGLLRSADIARESHRLKTLVFGIADYSASIGARLVSISGHEKRKKNCIPGIAGILP